MCGFESRVILFHGDTFLESRDDNVFFQGGVAIIHHGDNGRVKFVFDCKHMVDANAGIWICKRNTAFKAQRTGARMFTQLRLV